VRGLREKDNTSYHAGFKDHKGEERQVRSAREPGSEPYSFLRGSMGEGAKKLPEPEKTKARDPPWKADQEGPGGRCTPNLEKSTGKRKDPFPEMKETERVKTQNWGSRGKARFPS